MAEQLRCSMLQALQALQAPQALQRINHAALVPSVSCYLLPDGRQ